MDQIAKVGYKRIATEEAFSTAEVIAEYRRLFERHELNDPGFYTLVGFFLESQSDRGEVMSRMEDLDEQRIADMDAAGIDVQLLSLTSPGVQVFDTGTAVSLARASNDHLAEAVKRHPDRFAGLACIAPQDPGKAATELRRGVTELGLKGAIINSHTHGEYLDDPKFDEIFATAVSLDVPIYLHPYTPPAAMIDPFLERGLDGVIFGFAVETALHSMRLIMSGVFDRYPTLRIVLGHLGEALPFWLSRFDFMYRSIAVPGRYPGVHQLDRKVSDYLKENFYYTTSGMPWEPGIMFVRSVIGAEHVMYAMDYPYQYVPDEVRQLDQLPISESELRDFYQLTAERVFHL